MTVRRDIDLGPYLVEHHPGDDVLWITFDHAGLWKHAPEGRPGWAVPELVRAGWSVLAVKARRPDWFLQPEMAAFFRGDAFAAIREGKRRVILYGLSMGGFAALAYSTLVPGSTVMAISPQTTLHPAKVPWEKRFDYARGEDWDGPFGDVAGLTPAHAEAFVLYSPRNRFDGPHVERIAGFRPLTLLPLRGNAHVPGGMLTESGLLKRIVRALASGAFSVERFAAMHEHLEASAAYHFHVGLEAEDAGERDAALARCLELARPERIDFYRQRIAALRMRLAAKASDREACLEAYRALRGTPGWGPSVQLKIMAGQFLARAGAPDRVRALIDEIRAAHPDGHPKVDALIARCEAAEAAGG